MKFFLRDDQTKLYFASDGQWVGDLAQAQECWCVADATQAALARGLQKVLLVVKQDSAEAWEFPMTICCSELSGSLAMLLRGALGVL